MSSIFLPPYLEERIATLRRRAIHNPRNPDVREVVRLRANDACEYCLLPTVSQFHIEHIVPSHLWGAYVAGQAAGLPPRPGRSGPNHIDNYAWSCPFCNGAKSKRVAHGAGRTAIRFFDPRYDHWPDHFIFMAASKHLIIVGKSEIGRVTSGPGGLHFNAGGVESPLGTRHNQIMDGNYPPAWARAAYDI